MKRWEIVQYLINKNDYRSYLEIGVSSGKTFNKIRCENKDGVDPRGRHATHRMTSDEFFSRIGNKKYDIIFIDGLHIEKQVDRDIKNSLRHLTKRGIIVMHDCNPPSEKHQAVPRLQKVWNGTVWKSFVKLRLTNPHLRMCVIDTDWGCGIIKRGNQELYDVELLDVCLMYEYFSKHKKELLNLISVKDFIK